MDVKGIVIENVAYIGLFPDVVNFGHALLAEMLKDKVQENEDPIFFTINEEDNEIESTVDLNQEIKSQICAYLRIKNKYDNLMSIFPKYVNCKTYMITSREDIDMADFINMPREQYFRYCRSMYDYSRHTLGNRASDTELKSIIFKYSEVKDKYDLLLLLYELDNSIKIWYPHLFTFCYNSVNEIMETKEYTTVIKKLGFNYTSLLEETKFSMNKSASTALTLLLYSHDIEIDHYITETKPSESEDITNGEYDPNYIFQTNTGELVFNKKNDSRFIYNTIYVLLEDKNGVYVTRLWENIEGTIYADCRNKESVIIDNVENFKFFKISIIEGVLRFNKLEVTDLDVLGFNTPIFEKDLFEKKPEIRKMKSSKYTYRSLKDVCIHHFDSNNKCILCGAKFTEI